VTQPDIGIVVVTYHSGAEIGPCLDAALPTGADIVVVDNASTDGTLDEVRRRPVRLIANSTNRGFAAAVNQGFAVLQRPYVLLLNPDSVLQTDLAPLRDACALPGAGGAGGLLLDSAGRPQIGFMVRRFPTVASLALEALLLNRVCPRNRVNRRYRALDLDYKCRSEVEQPAGAFLMLRRAVWQELGGFDEGYFPLWFEEVDFCRRAATRGYRLFFEPKAVAKHAGAHSISQLTVEMRRIYWYRSLLKYAARHFRPLAFRAVCLAVAAGSVLRMIAESVLERRLQPMAAYGEVVRLAGRALVFGWRTN
jgi:N-acetylglucosaminyl-diphospho-decaprenol L-rhamnosyltransferase